MTFQPLPGYHLVRLLPVEEQTAGGVWLPETAQRLAFDGVVEAVGPERLDADGEREVSQATYADRVVTQAGHFRSFVEGCGVVADRHLLAVLPGPDWSELRPANDWVALRRDSALGTTDTGLLLAVGSMRGGESRWRERGEQLYREFYARGERLLSSGMPQWERVALHKREVAALSKDEAAALSYAYERRGKSEFESRAGVSSRRVPQSGLVVGYGGKVPAAIQSCGTGVRVWWDEGESVELFDGEGSLLLVRADALSCIEV